MHQLIDSIRIYSEVLDENGKTFLINFVLKTRINQSAKLRLQKSYDDITGLVQDMQKHLLPKKSETALSVELHNCKQGNKSVEEFGKSIEYLFTQLTLTQANGDEASAKILTKVNERVAINIFANGLRDTELKTITKAKDFSNLKDAINSAKDEETIYKSSNNAHLFNFRGRGKNVRHGQGKFFNKNQRQTENTHTRNTFYPNQQYHRQGRGRYFRGNRPSNYRRYNTHQNTYAAQTHTNTNDNINKNRQDQFFRGQERSNT